MATAPPRTGLDDFRAEADRFLAALDEEFYLHFAGHKERFELKPIYERYADLTSLEAAARLAAAAEGGSRGEIELWRFACEGYLGDLTRAESEGIAGLEASLTANVDGREIPFRMLRPEMANEPDRERRARLDAVRIELAEEHLESRYVTAAEKRREGTRELGAPTYRELYTRFRFPLDPLAEQCRSFLEETEDLYVSTLDRLFRRRVGIPLEEAGRWDVPRLFRASEWDEAFPADGMVPALEWTLSGLGIDLRSQRNIHLDIEPRPRKSPRAFCAPIEVPGRVMLVIQPIGGPDDWHAFFHEAGHAEHYAHTSASLPTEARRLGDNAVTEGWAMLLDHLTNDPAWLSRRLDFARPEDFAAEGAAELLYFVRRYCGKLLYELELQGDGELEPMRARYVEWLREATKIEPSPADFLADVDEGFYVCFYLRAWALQAQLRTFLRDQFGSAWFTRREAGSLLQELWHEGQSLTADELLDQVAGAELELSAVAENIRAEVAA
jgi:hypothetical protein